MKIKFHAMNALHRSTYIVSILQIVLKLLYKPDANRRTIVLTSLYRWISLYTGLRFCESRISKSRKRETYNNRHFDVKLASEFFDAKLVVYVTSLVSMENVRDRLQSLAADRILMLLNILK
jgi:hypothetical protein